MSDIPSYQSGVIVNCSAVTVPSENRSRPMWVRHSPKASSFEERILLVAKNQTFVRNQLKQRNCPEISHQKNCRGHNIKNTIHRRNQNESPSNISSKCGRISSLQRAKRSLPNTKLSNFEVQHSIIQLGNVFCPKTPLSRQFIFLQIDCASEIRWPPKHKSFPNLQARLGWKKHSLCWRADERNPLSAEEMHWRTIHRQQSEVEVSRRWLPMSVGNFVAIQGSWEN